VGKRARRAHRGQKCAQRGIALSMPLLVVPILTGMSLPPPMRAQRSKGALVDMLPRVTLHDAHVRIPRCVLQACAKSRGIGCAWRMVARPSYGFPWSTQLFRISLTLSLLVCNDRATDQPSLTSRAVPVSSARQSQPCSGRAAAQNGRQSQPSAAGALQHKTEGRANPVQRARCSTKRKAESPAQFAD
jgi:hypothetical protein